MGKKINPLGFRLGANQSHRSIWFAQSKSYSKGLQEDEKIRDCIHNYVEKNMKISSGFEGKGISHIEIQKKMDLIQVIIYMGSPNSLMEGRTRGIDELQTNVQKEFFSVNRRLNIAIIRVAKPYAQPTILAEHIALQLKNRVSFRKAMKSAIELTEQADTKGIQIQIAGRTRESKENPAWSFGQEPAHGRKTPRPWKSSAFRAPETGAGHPRVNGKRGHRRRPAIGARRRRLPRRGGAARGGRRTSTS